MGARSSRKAQEEKNGGEHSNGVATETTKASGEEEEAVAAEESKDTVVTLRNHGSKNGVGGARGSRTSRDSRLSKHTSFYEMVDASEINTYLLIGNQPSVENTEFLSRKRILFVLNLSNSPVPVTRDGIEYKSVKLEDDDEEDLLGVLQDCLDFLHKAKKKCESNKGSRVLVYSYFGLSRSASVCVAHLMKEEGWTLEKSWNHLKAQHPSAKPNDGFLLQLLEYEGKLYNGKISMRMQDFHTR
ncbi:PREDICTED: dual specificity protein phosphatase 1B-like [Amphimedon queenslandica]|uniref:protein-tyrosine-phosphatase n=1 Tax=Amphimedon queenslandica TaxID=400682 RepID=A0A1X7VX12_AMPQE|nr:PREDICTED: dual specificity protein phosphatase 1B-like [Amphimedon queenslandica]|eukprot:XP_011410032.1 PREDICTED: dual specificity protein phosphatase 1B-like [Amphimedon queenslandica]